MTPLKNNLSYKKWISVDERLPTKEKYNNDGQTTKKFLTTIIPMMGKAAVIVVSTFWYEEQAWSCGDCYPFAKVLAWQSLPGPYTPVCADYHNERECERL